MTDLESRLASIKLSTASELAEGLLGLSEYGYGFRGQSDTGFDLVSSLRRRMAHIAPEDRRRLEQKIVASFSMAAGDQLKEASTTGDVLSLMQHHAAPTRFLDFSYSPFVALYFLAESLTSSDGRLFVVDAAALQELWLHDVRRRGRDGSHYDVLPDHQAYRRSQEHNLAIHLEGATHVPLVHHPTAASLRMRSQSGFFLAEPLADPWVDELKAQGLLASIDIPGDLKSDLLRIALQTNNGGATLFPGLDGVGREIVERFLVDSPSTPFP